MNSEYYHYEHTDCVCFPSLWALFCCIGLGIVTLCISSRIDTEIEGRKNHCASVFEGYTRMDENLFEAIEVLHQRLDLLKLDEPMSKKYRHEK